MLTFYLSTLHFLKRLVVRKLQPHKNRDSLYFLKRLFLKRLVVWNITMTMGLWQAAKNSGPQEESLKLFLINQVSNYSTISLAINAECIWVSKYFCEKHDKVLTCCPALLSTLLASIHRSR